MRDKQLSDTLNEVSKGSDSCSFPSRFRRPGVGLTLCTAKACVNALRNTVHHSILGCDR